MYYSDKPISTEAEDLLNRSGFAKLIAYSLINSHSTDTFTIGLFGKWGCGKTSIVNMALQEISNCKGANNGENSPIIVNFEPWNFSDTNQLLGQFFIRLSNELRSRHDKSLAAIGDAIQKYSNAFELANAVPIIGPTISYAGELSLSALGKKLKKGSDESDILKQKKNVVELLKKQSAQVLVVVDDIDRLGNKQIQQVFQLITSVAKFPNMIYLLVFDKDIVANALEEVQAGNGEKYLEKIIQVPIQIPAIQPFELRAVLFKQLNILLEGKNDILFDTNYWQKMFDPCIAPFVKSLRDVYRLCNLVSFKLTELSAEVNFSDLIAISALEIHFPKLYEWLIENKSILTGKLDLTNIGGRDRSEKDWLEYYQSQIQALLNSDSSKAMVLDDVEMLTTFLSRLFPYFGQKIGKIYEALDYDNFRKNNNIGHPEKFDRYFNLNADCVGLKRNSIRRAVFEMGSSEFSCFLIELDSKGTSYEFLEEVKALLSEISPERATILATALWNTAHQFDTVSTNNIFSLSTASYAEYLLRELINKISNDERYSFILNFINTATLNTLPTFAAFLNTTELAFGRLAAKGKEYDHKKLIKLEELIKLEGIFCLKAEELLDGNNIFVLKNWRIVLYMLECLAEKYANVYIDNLLMSDENVLRYLESSVIVWVGGDTEYEIQDEYKKHTTNKRIIDAIKSAINNATFFSLSSRVQNICGAFFLSENGQAVYPDHIAQREVDTLLALWRTEA